MKKFLTWQEYLEKFDSFQEAYENYYELYDELQRKDNIINNTIKTIKELIDDSEDTTCYEITNTIKNLLIEELENSGSDE